MENNNPVQQPPVTPNVAPPAPQPVEPQVQTTDTSSNAANVLNAASNEKAPSSGNKIILWFVFGLVIIILAVGGIYFYFSMQQTTPTPSPSPEAQATPSPVAQENLESDLNNINVDVAGVTSDFTEVDQDLQQL